MKRNIVYSVFSLIILGLSGFISIPILTRTLTASDLGHVLLIITIVRFINSLDGLRSVVIANYHTYPPQKKGDFVRTIQIISNVLGVFVCIGIYIILSYFLNDKVSYVEKILISLSVLVYFPMSFQAALIDSRSGTGYTMLARAFVWLLIYSSLIIIAINQYDLTYLPIIFLLSNLLLLYLYHLKNRSMKNHKGSYNSIIFTSIFKQSKQNFAFLLVASTVGILDKLLLFTLKPIENLAIYAPNHELATKPNLIFSTVGRLLLPYLAKEKASDNNIERQWLYIFKITLLVSLLLTWGLNLYSQEIITIYAGSKYSDTYMILKLICLGAFLNVYGILSVVILNSFLDFSTQLTSYTISLFLGIVLGYLLIKDYSIMGAAILYVTLRTGDLVMFYLMWTNTLKQSIMHPLMLFTLSIGTHIFLFFEYSVPSILLLACLIYIVLKLKIKEI